MGINSRTQAGKQTTYVLGYRQAGKQTTYEYESNTTSRARIDLLYRSSRLLEEAAQQERFRAIQTRLIDR